VQDEDLHRSLVPRCGDRERAVVTPDEGVGGGAASIVLRATRELAEHAARGMIALRRGDPRGQIRLLPAVGRGDIGRQRDARDHELPVRVRTDSGVAARS
jgi:hypothetical protein